MSLENYIGFLIIALIATAVPGPAVLLAITNALRHGMKRTAVAIMGNVTGILLLAGVSALGLSAVIQTSELAFTAVKWLGGFYLVYLGVKMWRSPSAQLNPNDELPVSSRTSLWRLYGQALLVAVSNPKAIAFCTALFPQFIDPAAPMAWQFTLLAATFGLLSFVFLMLYAGLAQRSKHWLGHRGGMQWFNRVTGGLFVGLGAALTTIER